MLFYVRIVPMLFLVVKFYKSASGQDEQASLDTIKQIKTTDVTAVADASKASSSFSSHILNLAHDIIN